MMPFGRKLISSATKMASSLGSKGALKYGEKVSRGKYASRALAAYPQARPKVWGKGYTKISPQTRASANQALNSRAAAQARRRAPNKADYFPRFSSMGSGKKKALGAAGLAGIGMASFTSGIDSKGQVSNTAYDLAFGNPDYDKYVTGKKMGLRSLLAPVPGQRRMQGSFGLGTLIGQQPGSVLTKTTYTDAWKASRKNAPVVDGSIAFGMYNARLG